MNKKRNGLLGPLSKLSKLLRAEKKQMKPPSFLKKVRFLRLDDFQRVLTEHLVTLDSGVQILDHHFPILEGKAKVDLVASNNLGELIFVWAQESLKSDQLLEFIPQYEWAVKNQALWNHLFPYIRKGGMFRLKIWCFAERIDPEIKSVLSSLKGITISIFHYTFVKQLPKIHLEIQPWDVQKKQFTPPSFQPPIPLNPVKKANSLVSLTQEEIQDLISGGPEIEPYHEDEITEPFFYLSNLSEGKMQKA
jgi:hypothetical protein